MSYWAITALLLLVPVPVQANLVDQHQQQKEQKRSDQNTAIYICTNGQFIDALNSEVFLVDNSSNLFVATDQSAKAGPSYIFKTDNGSVRLDTMQLPCSSARYHYLGKIGEEVRACNQIAILTLPSDRCQWQVENGKLIKYKKMVSGRVNRFVSAFSRGLMNVNQTGNYLVCQGSGQIPQCDREWGRIQ